MTVESHPSRHYAALERQNELPGAVDPASIPKERLSRFSMMFIAFAIVVLAALVATFARIADEPRPTIDVAPGVAPAMQ